MCILLKINFIKWYNKVKVLIIKGDEENEQEI